MAVNQRAALNADAALDLGMRAGDMAPALRSCLAVPLLEGDALVAVLALYRERPGSFSDDELRLAGAVGAAAGLVAARTGDRRRGLDDAAVTAAQPALRLVPRSRDVRLTRARDRRPPQRTATIEGSCDIIRGACACASKA